MNRAATVIADTWRDFNIVSSKHFARATAPPELTLPAALTDAARKIWNKTVTHKGEAVEFAAFIDTNLEVFLIREGDYSGVSTDHVLEPGQVLLANLHTHPHYGAFDEIDIGFLTTDDRPWMMAVIHNSDIRVLIRTQEFDGIMSIYKQEHVNRREKINTIFEKGAASARTGSLDPSNQQQVERSWEAGTRAVARDLGLVYYRGTVGEPLVRDQPPLGK